MNERKENNPRKVTCLRCGYTWTPLREAQPKACTRCKSYRWNISYKDERKTQ